MSHEFYRTSEDSESKPPRRSFEKGEPNYLGPIFIVYRGNDFLNDNVQTLADMVQGAGGEIEVHSFPAETEREEIGLWYEQNKGRLQGKKVITDWTCKFAGEEGQDVSANLDQLFTNAALKSIEKREGVSFRPLLEGSYKLGRVANPEIVAEYDRAIEAIIRTVYNDLKPEEKPEAVYLIKNKLADHYPIPDDLDPEVTNAVSSGVRFPEIPPHVIDAITERVRASIISAGIPESIITVIDNSSDLFEDRPSADQKRFLRNLTTKKSDWILVDRHVLKNSNDNDDRKLASQLNNRGYESQSATILRLPLGDLISDAQAENILDGGDDVVDFLEQFLLEAD
jgi:hypothetical protein